MTTTVMSFEVDFAVDKKSQSRKAAFLALGKRIAALRIGSTGDEIAMHLLLRDRLGSVAIGQGVAIPHAVFPISEEPLVCVSRLTQPIDFSAPDGEPVDLIFAIAGDRRDQRKMRRSIDRSRRIVRNGCLLHGIRTASSRDEVARIFGDSNSQEAASYPLEAATVRR